MATFDDLNLILMLGMKRFHEIESQEEDMDKEHRKIFLDLLRLL
jgi:hypothetical protein